MKIPKPWHNILSRITTVFLVACYVFAMWLTISCMIGWINIVFLFVATLALCWHLLLLYIDAQLTEMIKAHHLEEYIPGTADLQLEEL